MEAPSANDYDVVIVGAGPAGSSLAIRLAQIGLKTLLVEQKKFPRAKLCGEFISPECLGHFAELDVLQDMNVAGAVALERTVFYARNGKSIAVPSEWFQSNSYALGLSRTAMDNALLEKALGAGARVMQETHASRLIFEEEKVHGVRLKNNHCGEFAVRAPLTVDATGRAGILTRQWDIGKRKRAPFVAFKTHLKGADIPPGDCEIYSYHGGYGGCTGIENGLHNLCFIVPSKVAKEFGGDAETIMQNTVLLNKRIARALRGARTVEDWLAVPIERYGRAELAPAVGLLTVGDAAAFIDPFTGGGILLALQGSQLAARVIIEEFSKPYAQRSFAALAQTYHQLYGSAFDRRLYISSTIRTAAFVRHLPGFLISILSSNDRLLRGLVRATR